MSSPLVLSKGNRITLLCIKPFKPLDQQKDESYVLSYMGCQGEISHFKIVQQIHGRKTFALGGLHFVSLRGLVAFYR